jgi:hypothetical protein
VDYLAQEAVDHLVQRLEAPDGVNFHLELMQRSAVQGALDVDCVSVKRHGFGQTFKTPRDRPALPHVTVEMEKLTNDGSLKFFSFSGSGDFRLRIRARAARREEAARRTAILSDAVARVLEHAKGAWDEGVYYGGGYALEFAPVEKREHGFECEAAMRLRLLLHSKQ